MARFEAVIQIPKYGLATSFGEAETPKEYALRFRNRFINNAGSAEKRQGMRQIYVTVPNTPNLTGIHEMIRHDGVSVRFVSGEGKIWRWDDPTWTQVHSGWSSSAVIRHVQMDNKIIFFNGVDRQVYFEDKTGTTPGDRVRELKGIIEQGEAGGTATSAGGLDDGEISNWALDTDVTNNDLVFNVTQNAYGLITAVTSGNITHTTIGSVATGLGQGAGQQAAGDRYEIVDLVENNIIPTVDIDDNVGVASSGTSSTLIRVSAVNFANTDARAGDFIYNSTRSAVMMVSAVATGLTVTSVASQVANDSLVFLKPAMPVASDIHIHYGRAYYLDSRDMRKIRISGPNDPQDLTSDTGTLDTISFQFGNLQPQGDVVKAMSSYQRFFVVGGRRNVYLYAGIDPIADTSSASTDFVVVGSFPQGIVSPDSLVSLGNDLAFMTLDGVQTIAQVADASDLGRENISEAIKSTLRDEVGNASEDDIILLHYPRRSWLFVKVSSQVYIFNYSESVKRQSNQRIDKLDPHGGSWSLFDGKFARQNAYFIANDGTFLCAGAGGKVYEFDADGIYADDGEVYTTEYQTTWLQIPKTRTSRTVQGHYIRPILDAGAAITYTIKAEGDFDVESSEEITVSVSGGSHPIGLAIVGADPVGGTSLQDEKYGLRWRGKRARITFTTNDTLGPDVISSFAMSGNIFGVR